MRHIQEFNFDQSILALGETLPAGEQAVRAVFQALNDMTLRCESVVEEIALRREAYDLVLAMRIDELGAAEEAVDNACAALMNASAMRVFGFDEETFWLELKVPGVFKTDTFDPKSTVSFVSGKKREPLDVEERPPAWLVEALQAAKEGQEQLTHEDFLVEHPIMDQFLDLYNACKRVAADAAAEFMFDPPRLPMKEHGSCYLVAKELTLQKAAIEALFPLIARASSFSISYCADDRVRIGAEISFIYAAKE